MTTVLTHLRLAARSLLRARGSSALMLGTIAVGVGGVAAVFSVVNALALRPLPFEDPLEIVTLEVTSSQGHGISTSIPNYRDWRDGSRVFVAFGALAGWSFKLTGKSASQIISGEATLGDMFRVMGVQPILGRVFTAAETEPGSPPVVVLGHAIWQSAFGADPALIGQSITLDGKPYTVLGVLPPDFQFPTAESQIYVNMGSIDGLPWDDRNSSFGTRIFARMKPGTPLVTAASEVARVGREAKERAGPETALPSLVPIDEWLVGSSVKQLWLLMAAVGVVLAVAFFNVGGLLLARAIDRRRDAAVRIAIGGNRRVVIRQFVTETLLLSLTGGVLGLILAVFLVRALIPMLPSDLSAPLLARIAIDWRTSLVTLGTCAAAGLILGVAAGGAALPVVLAGHLRGGARGVTHTRRGARGALIAAETALSLVLAIEATLLLASFRNLQKSDKGFDHTNVLTARVAAPQDEFQGKGQWLNYLDALTARARALPGVTSAAVSLLVPLTDRSWEQQIRPEGSTIRPEQAPSVLFNITSSDYFQALGVPLVRGRAFANGDVDTSLPVAVVDETLAKQFWPDEDPLGKRVEIGERNADSSLRYRTVVGITKNVRHYALATPSRIQIYIPLTQTYDRWGMGLYVLLKTRVAPSSLVAPLRAAGADLNPRVPIFKLQSADEILLASISGERALGVTTSWLAAVAALVTAVGLFGIVSYAVIQRRREIALRMALGAEPRSVVALITWNGAMLALIGVVAGLVVALGLSRVMKAFLHGVGALDAGIFAGSAAALLAISTLAALLPALSARRLAPASVLRED